MTDFYSQNRCVCSTRSHGPLLCAFCLSFHFNALPATEQLLEEGKTCLEQLVVTPGMIEAKIKGLKDNKSPGADGISPRLLKEIVDDISVPLAIAFNLSIQDGIVPREWKMLILYLSSKRAVDVSLKTTDQLV